MRLGIVSDIHLVPAGTAPVSWHNPLEFEKAADLLGRAIAFFTSQEIDAVAVLGDLTHFGDQASIERGLAPLGQLSVPVYVVAGNHDVLVSTEHWRSTIEGYDASQISVPNGNRNGSFPLRFAGIGDIQSSEDRRSCYVPDRAIDAPADKPLVMITHFPLLNREDDIVATGLKYAGGYHWGSTGEELLGRTAPTIVLHGHLHIRYSATEAQILQIGFAALIEPPHAVAVVEIAEKDGGLTVSVEHHDVDRYDVAVVPVLAAERAVWSLNHDGWTETVLS